MQFRVSVLKIFLFRNRCGNDWDSRFTLFNPYYLVTFWASLGQISGQSSPLFYSSFGFLNLFWVRNIRNLGLQHLFSVISFGQYNLRCYHVYPRVFQFIFFYRISYALLNAWSNPNESFIMRKFTIIAIISQLDGWSLIGL